ncbi:insulin-like growth factor 1 receptor isoform X2 [Onthophagus taurus]|uniref:insulin-like growth factor 1 receptor isoform X2 n=1 Tax=Onthophagus taurus TaxID=166361 RepID=UPI0039BE77C9
MLPGTSSNTLASRHRVIPNITYLLLVLIPVATLVPTLVDAKYCSGIKIRNKVVNIEKQLRGCEVIIGDLDIVLMDRMTPKDFENVSFPELREITGIVVIYQVRGLTSLGKLFPNLRVIHGEHLFEKFALIIHKTPDLVEIGLSNLVSIEQGGVRIQGAPKLGYIFTIDWSKITKYQNVTVEKMNVTTDFAPCPEVCNGFCWNSTTCQTCMDNNSSEKCNVCRRYTYEGKCVDDCPKNKYKLGFTCVSFEECRNFTGKDMYILETNCTERCPKYHHITNDNQCQPCGRNSTHSNNANNLINKVSNNIAHSVPCHKVCNETVVDNIGTLHKLEGCTIINGSLTINGRYNFNLQPKQIDELILSLPFYLDQIKEITGSLKIQQMEKLKNLHFLSSLEKIGTNITQKEYALYLVDNLKLNDLFSPKVTENLQIGNGSLSIHYNPLLCLQTIENLTMHVNKLDSYTNNVDISLESNGEKAICHETNMHVIITNRSSNNITLKWDKQSDLKSNQTVYFVYYALASRAYQSVSGCDNAWSSELTTSETITLKNLEPFSTYTYYISAYVSTDKPSDRKDTAHANFSTLPDDPSPPQNFNITPISSSDVFLSWSPPEVYNGDLSGYKLYVYAEPDNPALILERDYCKFPHDWPKTMEFEYTEEVDKCDCETRENTMNVFDQLCYHSVFGDNENCQLYSDNLFLGEKRRRSNEFPIAKTIEHDEMYMVFNINASSNNYTLTNLEQFTLYVFLFSACNHPPNLTLEELSSNEQLQKKIYCSSILMKTARTLENETADIVKTITYYTNDKDCILNWSEPSHPNQVIVSYEIECNTTIESQSFFHSKHCLRKEKQNNQSSYILRNLEPRNYSCTIYSVTLAGKSKLGPTISFIIHSHSDNKSMVITFSVLSALAIIAAAVAFWFYRKHVQEENFKNLRMFASINPEYAGAMYEPDEWEMERENIEILKELGQGSFGMVCSGFIKSQNIPCAVKTVNEHCQHKDCMQFLNEASIMKSFNSAHHVVKLLGVVSKGNPPLVIMELMARGDLKSYLRRSRESSHDITCVEMYRMAAEIADGMLYLSAKKFIHRDLAARNCMVSADHTVKIGDFGMAKDIYITDYYRQASKGMMPVRWMSPESLADGVFTSDSDVWSYGVVLWEMSTLAEQPYQGLANEQVIQFIVAKGTLERPSDCPDLLYEIMQVCWKWKPVDRPRFTDIVAKLENHIREDFRLVSFYHCREGEEFRMNNRERIVNPPALLRIPVEDEYVGMHWNASDDDEVSLYSGKPKNSLLHRSKTSSNFRLNSSTPKKSFSSKSMTPS